VAVAGAIGRCQEGKKTTTSQQSFLQSEKMEPKNKKIKKSFSHDHTLNCCKEFRADIRIWLSSSQHP